MVSGEDITVQNYLSSQSLEKLKSFVGDNRLLVVDEAQKIRNIGLNLKLIVDHMGSPAFPQTTPRTKGEALTSLFFVFV